MTSTLTSSAARPGRCESSSIRLLLMAPSMNKPVDVVVVRNGKYSDISPIKWWARTQSGCEKPDMIYGALSYTWGLEAPLPTRLYRQAKHLTFSCDLNVSTLGQAKGQCSHTIAEAATNLLSSLAKEREASGRTTTPIIFIAHSLGGLVLLQALKNANDHSKGGNRGSAALLDNTYGVLFLSRRRPRRIFSNICLTVGQILCSAAMRGYEGCHRFPTGNCATASIIPTAYNSTDSTNPPWTAPFSHLSLFEIRESKQILIALLSQLLSLLHLQDPTIPLFVCAAMAYGILAISQYHINRRDWAQQIFVLLGLVWVLWSSSSFWPLEAAHSFQLGPLALGISAAQGLSFVLHRLTGKFFRARKSKLVVTLGEWVQDACSRPEGSRRIKYQQVQ